MSPKRVFVILILIALTFLCYQCSEVREEERAAMELANSFALESSIEIRDEIERTSKCPKIPKGWEDSLYDEERKSLVIKKGSKVRSFPIWYKCRPNLKFDLMVIYSFDSETFYSGQPGERIKITYGHFTEPEHLYVKDKSEIMQVINKMFR